MTERYVFDAWAMLAYFHNEEPAAAQVAHWLEAALQKKVEAYISVINLGEIYYRVGKTLGAQQAEAVLVDLESLPLHVIAAENDLVFSAARWKMRHRLSYADAFAIATAQKLGATLVTGDPELIALEGEQQMAVLRRGEARKPRPSGL